MTLSAQKMKLRCVASHIAAGLVRFQVLTAASMKMTNLGHNAV